MLFRSGTTTNTAGEKGASTSSNGKTDAELADMARQKQFEDVNESWKKKDEYIKNKANGNTNSTNKGNNSNNVKLEQVQRDYANIHSEINHKKDQISNYDEQIKSNKTKIDELIENVYNEELSTDERSKMSSEIERLNNSVKAMEQSNKKTEQEINELNKKESDILKTMKQLKK